MKLSKKYYERLKRENPQIGYSRLEPRFNGSQLEMYGEICRLEEALKHARWTSFKKQEKIKKQLKEYEKKF